MIKCYSASFTKFMMSLMLMLSTSLAFAQPTTLITLPNPPFDGQTSLGGPSNISFVLQNTNPYAVNVTGISNWLTTSENNSVWELWYSETALSGNSTNITIAPWTQVAVSQPTPATGTGIAPINFPGLSFSIPANTMYRFVLRNMGPGNTRYSGTSSISPNNFAGGGVNLLVGDFQVNGAAVGYSGTGTGLTLVRFFTGSITFEPAGPCTNPPVPGTVQADNNPVCLGVPFTLSLDGGTGGTGQTYQWQSSPDNVTFTPIAGATSATFTTSQTTSTYYNVIVTCGVPVTSGSILVNTPAGVQGTFTIDNLLPPSATNFTSFNAAYNFIKCGIVDDVIFNVGPTSGPYNEQLIMEPVPGASAANTVTFNGNGRTITFNSTTSAQRGVIKLDGADHITFNDLVVEAPGTTTTEYGFGFHLINDADSNTINNCTINLNQTSTSTNYAGIVISSSHTSATTTGSALSDGNKFTNNKINGGYYGIVSTGSTSAANQNNLIKGNRVTDFYFYGIYMVGNFQAQVDSNYISRPNRTSVSTFMGIYFSSLNVSCHVTRNRIFNPFGGNPTSTSVTNGIHFTGVDALAGLENKVYNNVLYNFSGQDEVNALHNIGSDNVWYMHNTIVLDGEGIDNARGFYQTTTAAGIRFVNNIVAIYRGGTGAKYGIYYNTAASEVESNRNDFYLNATGGNDFTGYAAATPHASLAAWQAATGDDANSVANAPQFEDMVANNYMPTNATIDNLGGPEGVLNDVLGVTRSLTTPDLGAYEFTPGNCISPPAGGQALVNNTPVCEGLEVQLSLTGHNSGIGQTYQWEASANQAGPYTPISGVLNNPVFNVTVNTTQYFRAVVTCGAASTPSEKVLVTVTPALPAGNYTIGGPAGPTNFANFNEAIAAMSCGIAGHIVIDVVPNSGPYNEQVIIPSILGSSINRTVTFNGNGNTLAFSSDVTGQRAVLKLDGTDYFRFDSLIIDARGTGTYGFGVQLINDADSNIFTRNTILTDLTTTSTNYAGFVMSGSHTSATTTGSLCDGNVLDGNTIIGGYYNITCLGSSTVASQNNVFINNKVQDFYLYGIYLNGNFNALVEHNEISRPTRTNSSTHYGVYVTSLNVSCRISKNRIFNPFGGNLSSTSTFNGIYFTGVDALAGVENIVSNNAIYDINGQGDQYGLYNSSSDNVRYYHNSISLIDQANTTANFAYGFYQTTTASGIDVRNNIFQITRSGSSNNVGIFLNTAASEVTSNYNNFNIGGANPYIGNSGGLIPTLALWQAATSQDANSLTLNPFFANANGGNLMPMSPALDDKGTPGTGITTDILDAARSATTPDIGAWEFAVPPCTTPPVPGDAAASPNSGICMGVEVNLSLSANSVGSGQTYQWQYSTSSTGPWTNLGDPMMFADTTILATSTLYYQVAVTCNGNTTFSSPALVSVNPAFLAGDYTIDPGNPVVFPNNNNFASFNSAVAQLECGITGSVNFYVAPGTYTEQVRMHAISGTGPQGSGPDVRVTFMSADGNPASVNLTWNSTEAAANYTLSLDSASYVTYKNMTITATNPSFGRAVQLAGTASFDSIMNNAIVVPAVTSTSNVTAGVFADAFVGGDNVIKNNVINGGNTGIYLDGTSATNTSKRNVVDSNTVAGQYQYGIYIGFHHEAVVTQNMVNVTAPRNTTSYGIYSNSSDSAFKYNRNVVTMENNTTTIYGMYFTGCEASSVNRGSISGNEIISINGNSGSTYGIYHTGVDYASTVNNVVNVKSESSTSYGLYHTGGVGCTVYNNTVVNQSMNGTTNNVAAYLTQTTGTGPSLNIRNNIFSHIGTGRAMYTTNLNFIYSDYNTFYSAGTVLIQNGTATYPTLSDWIAATYWDLSSISIEPALVSNSDLRPDLADPDVWAIHGRGVQIETNDADILGNPRPTTLTSGVPDMGAYEFLPTAEPTVLTGIPAVPVAGGRQYFMYGTDTVSVITYAPGAPVPSSISLKRYSGVIPPSLASGQQSMYYYFDVDVNAQGAYSYSMQNYYVDSWQGFINNEATIKLGRTDASNAWVVNAGSTVDHYVNYYSESNLQYIDKFTGLTDGTVPPSQPQPIPVDSSNAGTRFWVAYGHHYDFSSNAMDMVLYLSATQAANVTVRVNGTPWVKTYSIAANTAIVSDILPKSGLVDARITDEGLFDRGISITSDVPIVAYAHIYNGSNSGAGMLLPVGVYGYEYQSLNSRQYYPAGGAGSYSWFFVVADHDSTLVEITPAVDTKLGHPAGVPFQVYLNKGQVYNVMGTQTGAQGTDMSGSTIKSIANASGNCFPIGVFSGSSRTAICNTTNGDNMIQQVFPSQAWGTKYATFATANSTSGTQYISNMFRVMVKDPTTQVTMNGSVLNPASLIVPGNYYEFFTPLGTGPGASVFVEADKPVMVAQYMVSDGGTQCPGVSTGTSLGDPEMIYISPIEQGIKKAVFYNTNESAITSNYINVVISNGGFPSLRIDGGSTFTDVFPHPNLPGYTCVRHNLGSAASQHIIESDSAFTAITYGLGSVESYGYNAGTLVKNLNGIPFITNTLGNSESSSYTCTGAPFRFSVYIPLKPTSITWEFSNVANLNPNVDSVQTSPAPVDSIFSNGRWLYRYEIQHTFTFTLGGTYQIPIHIEDPSIEGCDNVQTTTLVVTVYDAPEVDFSTNFTTCVGQTLTLTGSATTPTNVPISTWTWDFGGGNNPTGQNQTFTYNTPGTYDVGLSIISQDGCIGDTVRQIVVNEIPAVEVVEDTLYGCGADGVTFEVLNPETGVTYNWYTAATGGTLAGTGTTFTINPVSGVVRHWVEAVTSSGCVSSRTLVYAEEVQNIATPVAVVDSAGADLLRFRWDPVPDAIAYEVTIDGGLNWITPSSGTLGLTHTITNLLPLQSVTLQVRALGVASCQVATSDAVTGTTVPTDIFIPNAFTPNGDGLNDMFLVYGYTIQSMRMSVFNQWGQKIFESTNQATGWNGTYQGKMQPSGVYMYVIQMTLRDGTTQVKKGSINLVR